MNAPACVRCGAPIQVPVELHVLEMRCGYCGAVMPVPDIDARRRAAAQQQQQQQVFNMVAGSIQNAQNLSRNIGRMVAIFVGVIFLVVAIVVVASLANSM